MTETPPLICAECGNGFALQSQPGRVNADGQRVQRNVVTATPMWCPDCLAKRAKPNPYLEQEERHAKGMKEMRQMGWRV